jgi:hypothetical protein
MKINGYAYFSSPRCGATTRRKTTCQSPAVRNKQRCRMHGGTKGSGAPVGSQNALQHGYTTREAKELRKSIKTSVKNAAALITIFDS